MPVNWDRWKELSDKWLAEKSLDRDEQRDVMLMAMDMARRIETLQQQLDARIELEEAVPETIARIDRRLELLLKATPGIVLGDNP